MNSYLKVLAIQNYQSHKVSELHLHEGVNVLIGPSDNGKSVVMRSLKWLCTNSPKGEAFRSTWGGRTLVEGEFSDGLVVGRQKDKESKDNIYYINDADYKIEQNGNVPDEVVSALNMGEVNIQSQLDPIFFLQGVSPGERAKMLNQAANLSEIDTTVSNIKSMVDKNKKEIKTVQSQIAELERQQATFHYLEQMEKDVAELERLEGGYRKISQDDFNLAILLTETLKMQAELIEINSFLRAEISLTAALTLSEEEKAVTEQIQKLQTVLVLVTDREKQLKEIETFLNAEKEVEIALQTVTNLYDITKEEEALLILLAKIEKSNSSIWVTETLIFRLENEYKELMPSECPLCGGRMK